MTLYSEFYEDTRTGNTYEFLENQVDDVVGSIGGVAWDGDFDNEILFGTFWDDILYGDRGEDIIYGFEGDD